MKKKILISPLDWGLGHASRCVPVIQYFLEQELDVYLAGSGDAGLLLQQEFPDLPFFSLPSYNIHYPAKSNLAGSLLQQLPDILNVTKAEHQVLDKINQHYHFNAIFSDNRYGCWNKEVYSIFLTHQLSIRSPFLHFLTGPLIRKLHYKAFRKFNAIWIPDIPKAKNLAGLLSHPDKLPGNTHYIGALSRFSQTPDNDLLRTDEFSILILISGPEPQRSQFENILTEQISNIKTPVTLVRGKMEESPEWKSEKNVRIIPYLTSNQLAKEISKASLILCRSGYSSIMDLAFTGKRAVLIPTPGQTEQIYLANYHQKLGNFYSETQENFNFKRSIIKALNYNGVQIQQDRNLLDAAFKNIIWQL